VRELLALKEPEKGRPLLRSEPLKPLPGAVWITGYAKWKSSSKDLDLAVKQQSVPCNQPELW